jgi:hypothetical protein
MIYSWIFVWHRFWQNSFNEGHRPPVSDTASPYVTISCAAKRGFGASVEVQYQCNFADYREALQFVLKRTVGYYVLIVLGIVSVLVGSFVAYKIHFGPGLLMQLVGVFWLLWPAVVQPLWVRRDYRKHPNFSVPQVVNINEEGIQTVSDIAEGSAKWSAFTRFRETKNLFMIHMGSRIFRAIPKRALSASQIEELRQLLRSKLPSK